MNKKILASIFVIGMLALAMGYGTYSYFSDTEKSTGNTFTAGTINIAVNDQDKWIQTFTFADVKPCETKYITFSIQNIGTNPVVIWKHLKVTATGQGVDTEPELEEETEYPVRKEWTLDDWITYDLKVDSKVIFAPEDHIKVSDVDCVWMPLGTIAFGQSIVVEQSYHLQPEVTNWAQGDTMTFDIVIYGEQKLGNGPSESPDHKLFLDNKDGEPNWYFIPDDTWGILKYPAASLTFDYSFKGHGLDSSTSYSLIYYPEPQTTWPWPITVIGSGSTDPNGDITLSGTPDLGMDLTNAKIWLVLSSDIVGGSMSGWTPTKYLFEANKINYDDTNA